MLKVPAELKPEHVVAVIDSGEDTPLDLSPLRTTRCPLDAGDYSVEGLQHRVAVDHKSLAELLDAVNGGRDRFNREMSRLRGFATRVVVVDSPWSEIEAGDWESDATPAAVRNLVLGQIASGIQFLFADDSDTRLATMTLGATRPTSAVAMHRREGPRLRTPTR